MFNILVFTILFLGTFWGFAWLVDNNKKAWLIILYFIFVASAMRIGWVMHGYEYRYQNIKLEESKND